MPESYQKGIGEIYLEFEGQDTISLNENKTQSSNIRKSSEAILNENSRKSQIINSSFQLILNEAKNLACQTSSSNNIYISDLGKLNSSLFYSDTMVLKEPITLSDIDEVTLQSLYKINTSILKSEQLTMNETKTQSSNIIKLDQTIINENKIQDSTISKSEQLTTNETKTQSSNIIKLDQTIINEIKKTQSFLINYSDITFIEKYKTGLMMSDIEYILESSFKSTIKTKFDTIILSSFGVKSSQHYKYSLINFNEIYETDSIAVLSDIINLFEWYTNSLLIKDMLNLAENKMFVSVFSNKSTININDIFKLDSQLNLLDNIVLGEDSEILTSIFLHLFDNLNTFEDELANTYIIGPEYITANEEKNYKVQLAVYDTLVAGEVKYTSTQLFKPMIINVNDNGFFSTTINLFDYLSISEYSQSIVGYWLEGIDTINILYGKEQSNHITNLNQIIFGETYNSESIFNKYNSLNLLEEYSATNLFKGEDSLQILEDSKILNQLNRLEFLFLEFIYSGQSVFSFSDSSYLSEEGLKTTLMSYSDYINFYEKYLFLSESFKKDILDIIDRGKVDYILMRDYITINASNTFLSSIKNKETITIEGIYKPLHYIKNILSIQNDRMLSELKNDKMLSELKNDEMLFDIKNNKIFLNVKRDNINVNFKVW